MNALISVKPSKPPQISTINPAIDALIKRYELEDGDQVWLCTHQLKEYGIDLEKWERERKENM